MTHLLDLRRRRRGREGKDRLADIGATRTICGFLVLGVGVAGLIVTAIARPARAN